jgi:hypothetical protein
MKEDGKGRREEKGRETGQGGRTILANQDHMVCSESYRDGID